MSHANARTTFKGRLLIVERHQDGWPLSHIAKAMGMSRRCVRKWVQRYACEGEAGLHDRSSRPHSCPTRTSSAVEDKIVAMRRCERRCQGPLRSAQGRSSDLPGDGHEICPVMAMGSAQR